MSISANGRGRAPRYRRDLSGRDESGVNTRMRFVWDGARTRSTRQRAHRIDADIVRAGIGYKF